MSILRQGGANWDRISLQAGGSGATVGFTVP